MSSSKVLALQYLAGYPIKKIHIKDCDVETVDDQKNLLDLTILSSLECRFPKSAKYRARFLKLIIEKVEALGVEAVDDLYEEYCKSCCCHNYVSDNASLAIGQNELSAWRHLVFRMANGSNVVIRESLAKLSDGDTGLSLWKAGYLLADWAYKLRRMFSGKNVLELGCGLGLPGLVIIRSLLADDRSDELLPASYIFTDYSPRVLAGVRDNLERTLCSYTASGSSLVGINCPTLQDSSDSSGGRMLDVDGHSNSSCAVAAELITEVGCCTMQVTSLDWLSDCFSHLVSLPDIILASDIAYSEDDIRAFANVLRLLLKAKPDAKAYIAQTIRNEMTFDHMLNALDGHNLCYTKNAMNVPAEAEKSFPFYCEDEVGDVYMIEVYKTRTFIE